MRRQNPPGGRILIKWNSSIITLKPSLTTPQIVHGNITLFNGKIFTISCIYAHNDVADSGVLWDSRCVIVNSTSHPWFVYGDFNCILNYNEKEGRIIHLPNEYSDFRECVINTNLMSLSIAGLFFTWSNL